MCERLCSFYIIIHSSGGWTGTLSTKCKLNMLILQTGWPTYHLTSRRKSAVIASTLIVFSRTFFCPFFKFVCFSFFVVRYKNTFLRERERERGRESERRYGVMYFHTCSLFTNPLPWWICFSCANVFCSVPCFTCHFTVFSNKQKLRIEIISMTVYLR